MENVIKTTPSQIEEMARSKNNAIQLRVFATDLVSQVNYAHGLMEIMYDFMSSYLNNTTALTLQYQHGMKLPDHCLLDEYVVVSCPAHLVKWKVNFHTFHGNCYMWNIDGNGRYQVSPDEFLSDMNDEYWAKYGRFMARKDRTIKNFNDRK